MSSQTQTKVRGVQFNYINFFWKEISWIGEMMKRGEYLQALEAWITLLNNTPVEIYQNFETDIKNIPKEVAFLRAWNKKRAIDHFNCLILTRNALIRYAKQRLPILQRRLSNIADKRQYFEKTSYPVPRGKSHTLRKD